MRSPPEFAAEVVSTVAGPQGHWFGVERMFSSPTQPCSALATVEPLAGGGRIAVQHRAFATGALQRAKFTMHLPERWNAGTLTAYPVWTNLASTNTGTVLWGLASIAVGDGGDLTALTGGASTSTDNGSGTANQLHIAPAMTNTVASASAGLPIFFQIYRDGTGDTFTGSAYLLGFIYKWTSDQATDV